MSEDLIIKTLTGLMVEQRSMTENQRRLAEAHQTMAKVIAEQGETLDHLTEASARQEVRFEQLLEIMKHFSETSADTRKRLAAVEADVAKLKEVS